ncbi:hypothetical protein [Alsobacter sp. R-9]
MNDLSKTAVERRGPARWIAAAFAATVAVGLITVGFEVASFETSSRSLRDAMDGAAGQASAQQVRSWAAQAGTWSGSKLLPVRSASLALDVELSAEKPDTARAVTILSGLLAAKPAHASGWQSAADLATVEGGSVEAALPLWRLSYTLAPNEGLVMLQRAMFGIENWKALQVADRDRVVHDLVAALTYDFDAYQYTLFQDVLKGMDGTVRSQVVQAVRARGPSAEKALSRMGVS